MKITGNLVVEDILKVEVKSINRKRPWRPFDTVTIVFKFDGKYGISKEETITLSEGDAFVMNKLDLDLT